MYTKFKTNMNDKNIFALQDNNAILLYINGKKYKYSNITDLEFEHKIVLIPEDTEVITTIGDFTMSGEYFLPTINCQLPLYKKIELSDTHYIAGYVALYSDRAIRIRKCPKLNTLEASPKFSKPYKSQQELKHHVDTNNIEWYTIDKNYIITRSK